MPIHNSRSERSYVDETTRGIAARLVVGLYRIGVFLIAGAAAGIAIYAFTVSFGEGARAVIFFLIPSLWGAYALAVYDGRPDAFDEISGAIANGLAVVTAVVIVGVLILGAPVSIANLALGTMEAFFFVMRISNQPSRYIRAVDTDIRTWVRAFLIMTTVLCGFMAIAL